METVRPSMQPEGPDVSMFVEERYGFVAVLLLLLTASAALNGTVLIVFKWNRLIRTVNNSMVANLAISDFLFVSLSCVTSVVSILHGDGWLQKQFLCRFLGYCNHLFQSVSSNACALISFHRFISIVIPQRKLFGHPCCSKRVTIALWTYTMLTLLPSAMRQDAYQMNPVLAACTHFGYPSSDAVFTVYSVGINFVLPLSLMVVFYTRIYKTVLRHKMSIVNDISNAEVVERKSKRLMVAVLGIFCVTWTPYSAALLFTACARTPLPNLVVYGVWFVNLLNTFFHPVLYAICNRMYLRCIIRFVRCRGPIRNVKPRPQVAVSRLSQRTCYTASNKIEEEEEEEEISTIAPLPGYECRFCPHCTRYSENYYAPALITNGTQTARLSVDQEPPMENIVPDAAQRLGCKYSTCSHCSLGSYSTRSSVPTVMRLPLRRYHRSASNISQASHFGCGPTPVDSGRSSFASQYVTTPGPCSARASLASRYGSNPASARASTVSQYVQHHSKSNSTTSSSFTDKLSDQQGSDKRGIQRVASDSSRQSIFSSYSALRSVRSSMSSRISHYLRMSHSTRSSVTSQCTSTYLPTPFSTRPNSPNAELEFLYMSGCSPRTTRQGSLFSRRSSSSGADSRYSSQISCLQIPESSLDIYEDIEPSPSDDESQTSGTNSPKIYPCQSPGSNYDKTDSRSSSTCQRVSVFMLGDFEPEDPTVLLDDGNTEVPPSNGGAFSNSAGKPAGSTSGRSKKTFRRSRPRASPTSPRQHSPRHFVADPSAPARLCGGFKSPIRCGETASNPCRKAIDSMNKAVGVVLSAKRLTAKARSAVFPFKPDTPVPELHPTIQIHRIPVKEPIRFIYEGPIPSNYYSFGAQKPMMSHLRVPGRPPNVPQTIMEEDLVAPSPTESSRPETPSNRRRKNASSWIAPPIIDVMVVDDYRSKDMRVECPGVLVEHHS